jgi:hypothetical protein
MTARTMGIPPTKALTAARENPAQFERTIATELPQELSKLPEAGGFFDVSSCSRAVKSAAQGGGHKKASRSKKAAVVPKTRKRAVIISNGFVDDGHPTILADPRGWTHRS